MRRLAPMVLIVCLLLSGCSGWLDASYHNVTPFQPEGGYVDNQTASVSTYDELCASLCELISSGTLNAIISVSKYDKPSVAPDMDAAIEKVMTTDPVAAYAVETITYEVGTNAGQPAVALNITYLHDRSEILKISHQETMDDAKNAVATALDSCSAGIVLYISEYEQIDIDQWVQDYAASNPDKVMEQPQVKVKLYPETGEARVMELKFTYQTSRDALRNMQSKVGSLFDAAVIYAGDHDDSQEQYYKLYSFLMGLFQEFQLDASITPAYSLLQHGVGDSKAFATVYAAMCQKIGLECITVNGTKNGESSYWNIIAVGETYYHVDLLQCRQAEEFTLKLDADMAGYVWDYSAYPSCVAPEEEPDVEIEVEE